MERKRFIDLAVLKKLVGEDAVEIAIKNAALLSERNYVSQLEEFIYDDIAKRDAFLYVNSIKCNDKELQKYYEDLDRNVTLMNQLMESELPSNVIVGYFWKFDKHLKDLLK